MFNKIIGKKEFSYCIPCVDRDGGFAGFLTHEPIIVPVRILNRESRYAGVPEQQEIETKQECYKRLNDKCWELVHSGKYLPCMSGFVGITHDKYKKLHKKEPDKSLVDFCFVIDKNKTTLYDE